jgi:hypothetical protein
MESVLNMQVTRSAPYLPSFSRSPARIIEPLVLASTWAFGNQKWSPIIGILTKKGINNINLNQLLVNTLLLKKEKVIKGEE